MLRDILTVNATLVAQRQNEEMKTSRRDQPRPKRRDKKDLSLGRDPLRANTGGHRIRQNMPELHSEYGYPLSLVLMAAVSVGLYWILRKRNWI